MLKYLKSKGRSLTIMVKKCIFIGYNEESKAYKLYNLLTKKLVVSRDVFNEAEAWSWSNEETIKEQPVVNEPDEPLHEVHHQLYHHLLNMLHCLLQEVLHLLGKVVVVNSPYNEVPSK